LRRWALIVETAGTARATIETERRGTSHDAGASSSRDAAIDDRVSPSDGSGGGEDGAAPIDGGGEASSGADLSIGEWTDGPGVCPSGSTQIDITTAAHVFNVGHALIDHCYDGASLGFSFGDNFVHGAVPTGATGNCIAMQTTGDPAFASAATGDYHPENPAASSYGAYAP
jgi:hypothetical protein